MSFSRYPAYKDSGVEWLGEIPEHWAVAGLGLRYRVDLGKMLDAKQIKGEHLAPYLRNSDVQWGYIRTTDLPEMDFDAGDRVRFGLIPGDLLVCEGGEVGRCAVWEGQIGECYYQKALHRVRPKQPEIDTSAFLFWVLHAAAASGIFEAGESKATIAHLPADAFRKYRFPFPPLVEQREVTAFLDRDIARIDALVGEQERLTELLKEKRQAVISHAVTKGLDPNAAMKDSGVEWLGEVPAHWGVGRMGYYGTVENGSTPSKDNLDYWTDGTIPWVASGEVNQVRVCEPTAFITENALAESSLRLIPVGAVLVGLVGQGKTRGMSAIMALSGAINQNLAAVVCGPRLVSPYLHHSLGCAYEYIREYGRGGQQAALNCEVLRGVLVAVPPREEQDAIVREVDKAAERFDALIDEARRAIELLQERRAALITAAVTGQIDVRGLA